MDFFQKWTDRRSIYKDCFSRNGLTDGPYMDFTPPSQALNCYKNLIVFIDVSRKIRNFMFPQNLEFWTFLDFLEIYKKTRAEISRKTHRRMPRDLSYETDLGPKTKTENRPFLRPFIKRIKIAAKAQPGE